jgi:hypothetical protein
MPQSIATNYIGSDIHSNTCTYSYVNRIAHTASHKDAIANAYAGASGLPEAAR